MKSAAKLIRRFVSILLLSAVLLVIINGYDGDEMSLKQAADYTQRLLKDYAEGCDFEVAYY